MTMEKKRFEEDSLALIQRTPAVNPLNQARTENSFAYLHFRSACVFLFVFLCVLVVYLISQKESSSCQPTDPSIANSAWSWSGEGRGPLSAGCMLRPPCSIT